MSVKQDRVAPRTVADIERKYNFGKSFSEVIGLIDDTRDKVDAVSSELGDKVSTTTLQRTKENIVATIEETGVNKVTTKTGYVFDSEGLKINKSGEEMSNLLDNKGMYVKRSGTDILVANSDGVTAFDLHAKTFLKVGSGDGRCRFEDYGINRTGCFWTGG